MTRTLLLALTLCLAPTLSGATEPVPPVHEGVSDHRDAWASWLAREREQQLQRLRLYERTGSFPRKPGEPGWHHQFLDANGVPCAVANLIGQSGHWDLVEHTAATRNDVVLSEVRDGPLIDWVLTSGLTLEEVAVIQEPGFEPMIEFVRDVEPAPDIEPAPILAEKRRLGRHLRAVQELLRADTEASLAKALDRLGDRVLEPPPMTPTPVLTPRS